MTDDVRKALEAAGWTFDDTGEFLVAIPPEEADRDPNRPRLRLRLRLIPPAQWKARREASRGE